MSDWVFGPQDREIQAEVLSGWATAAREIRELPPNEIIDWLKRRRETGEVEAKPSPGPPAVKGAALEEALPTQLRANPDFTLEEHRELFEETYGISVSTASISRAFDRLGLPLKKRHSPLRSAMRRNASPGASR